MKKGVVLSLAMMLMVSGCGKKEKKAEKDDYHATLSETLFEYYASLKLSDIKLTYSFFFDVDGDGVDEFFYEHTRRMNVGTSGACFILKTESGQNLTLTTFLRVRFHGISTIGTTRSNNPSCS
jgi:uncharacterized protein YcfL